MWREDGDEGADAGQATESEVMLMIDEMWERVEKLLWERHGVVAPPAIQEGRNVVAFLRHLWKRDVVSWCQGREHMGVPGYVLDTAFDLWSRAIEREQAPWSVPQDREPGGTAAGLLYVAWEVSGRPLPDLTQQGLADSLDLSRSTVLRRISEVVLLLTPEETERWQARHPVS